MANAKLTIAMVGIDENDVNRESAIIRRALIDVYGEKWLRQYLGDWLKQPPHAATLCIGKGNQLIIRAQEGWNEESLLRLKGAFDYLSVNGDTLVCGIVRSPISSLCRFDLNRITNIRYKLFRHMLMVGDFTITDQDVFAKLFNVFDDNLRDEYLLDCEEKNCKPINYWSRVYRDIKAEEIKEKDIDLYFEHLLMADKEILSKPMQAIPIISEFSYEYDENAEVSYIEKKLVQENVITPIKRLLKLKNDSIEALDIIRP